MRGVYEIAARYVCAGTRLASKSNVTSVSRTSFHAAPCRAHKRSVSLSSSLSFARHKERAPICTHRRRCLCSCLSNDTEIRMRATSKLNYQNTNVFRNGRNDSFSLFHEFVRNLIIGDIIFKL